MYVFPAARKVWGTNKQTNAQKITSPDSHTHSQHTQLKLCIQRKGTKVGKCWEALLLSHSGMWIVKNTVQMLRLSAFVSTINKQMIYLHVQSLPGVLSHEAKQGKERPPKAVKAGVTIVGVPSSFHTQVAFWTLSEMTKNKWQTNKQKKHEFVFYDHWKSTFLWQLLKLCSLKIKYIFKNNLEKHLSLDHVADIWGWHGPYRWNLKLPTTKEPS